MLRLVGALLLATFAFAASASADPVSILGRVETLNATGGLIPRTSLSLSGDPVTVTNPVTHTSFQCAGQSPIAVLDALTKGNWVPTDDSAGPDTLGIKSIQGAVIPPPTGTAPNVKTPRWVAYVGEIYSANLCTTAPLDPGTEVLFYPWCAGGRSSGTTGCFGGGALFLRFVGGNTFPDPITNVGWNIPVNIHVVAAPAPDGTGEPLGPGGAQLTTDENFSVSTADPLNYGVGAVQFPDKGGGHSVTLAGVDPISQATRAPDTAAVCVTDGHDGFCGSPQPSPGVFDVTQYPSDCATNGHDGYCGTTDTTGPTTHVSNITDKQVFKKKKGPGQIKGTIDPPDPNGTKGVQIRLTRQWTARVKVRVKTKSKSKKRRYRYKTVKRCAVWNDSTALLETQKCGTKAAAGKFYEADLGDLRTDFSLGFALTLPTGSYKLEVKAQDENGFQDPVTPGRNVISFTVQ